MGYNIDDEYPSKYLRASDLKGRTITVVISHVDRETIGNDKKLVLYFKGKEKGLVLNKTNSQVIGDAYGRQDTDDWRDGELELFSIMTDYQGKPVEAVRVRIPRRPPAARRQEAPPRREEEMVGASASGHTSRNAEMDDDIPF